MVQFMALLFVHWLADFVAQTNWQATNKGKSNVALGRHVATYTAVLAVFSVIIFDARPVQWAMFVVVNGVLHFCTDWCTSRINSTLFMQQFVDRDATQLVARRGFNLHDFFVFVGFDQLIHQITLGVTMVIFMGVW